MAYEPVLKVFVGFRVSYNLSELYAILFLRDVRDRYGMRPIWTDEGVWYPEACRFLRLGHHVYPLEWKNFMERMNQALKDRLENFDLFNCPNQECDRTHVCNVIRKRDDQPEYERFIQALSGALTAPCACAG